MTVNRGEYIRILLDGMSITHFAAYVSIMLAGAILYFAFDVVQSVKTDRTTPNRFSLAFMIRDNVTRALSVLLLICATVVFYDDFFGVPINAKLAFTQGLSIDALMGIIIKRGKNTGARKNLVKRYDK